MKILIACGGTAGHIFPGLALAEELEREQKNARIVLVVSSRSRDREYLQARRSRLAHAAVLSIASAPLPYKKLSPAVIVFAGKLIWAVLQSCIIFIRYRPDVVVGFGGNVSFAPVLIAKIFNVPTLIHEQNFIPGRANYYLARLADRVAVSFRDTQRYFAKRGLPGKMVFTGLPLRQDMIDRDTCFERGIKTGQDKKKFTITIVGGSQGAHKINELMLQCLSSMIEEELKRLRVFHLTGKKDYNLVREKYQTLPLENSVFEFFADMPKLYSVSDLLICRSGAGTIFEAASFGLPCILVPYPYGTEHQKQNARFLHSLGAALVLDEEKDSFKNLQNMLRKIVDDQQMRKSLSQKIKMLQVPQARQRLAQETIYLHKR
ncbi:MAG: undecaprenyldiphospho-muramoylpentapeptide beta-N-acetylglucosaminyltransferase [Candidatus Omnitrophica bacterium]|nr:undecaprenyldiphospho-muramoylpentapeptide beta-N-acetylglucosaminyltransferase [Candidatus Omnitrophota bacterium]